MQVIPVNVPDDKVDFFHKLVQNLGFSEEEEVRADISMLTDRHRELVEIERQKIKENPNYLLDWETVRKTLKYR